MKPPNNFKSRALVSSLTSKIIIVHFNFKRKPKEHFLIKRFCRTHLSNLTCRISIQERLQRCSDIFSNISLKQNSWLVVCGSLNTLTNSKRQVSVLSKEAFMRISLMQIFRPPVGWYPVHSCRNIILVILHKLL